MKIKINLKTFELFMDNLLLPLFNLKSKAAILLNLMVRNPDLKELSGSLKLELDESLEDGEIRIEMEAKDE